MPVREKSARTAVDRTPQKVLIYRLGSLGDTIVALPSLRLIARAFPNAERRMLTNFSSNEKAAPISTILGETGLVHGYFKYPIGARNLRALFSLRNELRRWSPDVLIYLVGPRGRLNAYRDASFFWWSGIRRQIGVPHTRRRQIRELGQQGLFESEAHRLVRCLDELGEADLENPENWELSLTADEQRKGAELVAHMPGRFVAVSVGTKMDTKDWGETNWRELLTALAAKHGAALGLVLVGAPDERELSERVSAAWAGQRVNLCGLTSPRVCAAVLERSVLFVGHDSGPMHLAAAVKTPCVAIFSAQNKPGEWFPFGNSHRVIYHQTECYGCRLAVCTEHNKKCILSITVSEVLEAIADALSV